MTEKLYDQDAYAVEFDAKVISCEAYQEKKESGYHVILDRTLFFPEEGGQSPDKGHRSDGCADQKRCDHTQLKRTACRWGDRTRDH